ncbi:hypothetical protein KBC03_02800 [Patescibacteria group bacterium]|nr:hypothetical protein [Patescibacteria group bacterium]
MIIHDKNDTDIPLRAAEHLGKMFGVKPLIINAEGEHIAAQKEPAILDPIAVESAQSNTSTTTEVRSFISDVVEGVIRKYENTQMELQEVIETIKQDFALDQLPIHAEKIHALKDMQDQLITAFEKHFDTKVAKADPRGVDATLRMIYLAMIDKYRIDHIDDMQYLREKVGLYGYAQQDPLVIYKKEAFEKFTKLMFNIKQESIAIVFRTDFTGAQ